jgi:isochorismate synthase EntC
MTLSLLPPKAPPVREYVVPLISRYQPGDILLAGGSATLLARGDRTLSGVTLADLPATLTTCFDGAREVIAAGAITSDGASCRITLCEEASWAGPLPVRRPFGCMTAQEEHAPLIELGCDQIAAGKPDEVALIHPWEQIGQRSTGVAELLLRLGEHSAHTYTVPFSGEQVLLGANPELLVARHGRTVTATPLTGWAERAFDPEEDRAIAARLLTSATNSLQHRYATDAVAAALAPYCSPLHISEPALLATSTVWQASASISGRLAAPFPTALELAAALHAIPAMSATGEAAGFEDGMGIEHDFHGGLMGWQDTAGDGEWAIALRGTVLVGPTAGSTRAQPPTPASGPPS